MEDLGDDPSLIAAEKMSGYQNRWKARFHRGQYRIVFELAKSQRRVIVITIGPRETAYRGMKRRS